jgi:predicted unusual protein kinase regulating ubiquinone biosynthesis (AarF/ABC1/UbiB family)
MGASFGATINIAVVVVFLGSGITEQCDLSTEGHAASALNVSMRQNIYVKFTYPQPF